MAPVCLACKLESDLGLGPIDYRSLLKRIKLANNSLQRENRPLRSKYAQDLIKFEWP